MIRFGAQLVVFTIYTISGAIDVCLIEGLRIADGLKGACSKGARWTSILDRRFHVNSTELLWHLESPPVGEEHEGGQYPYEMLPLGLHCSSPCPWGYEVMDPARGI